MHNCRTIEFEKHSEQDLIQTFKKMSKKHIRKQTFTLSSQEDGHGQYIITSLVSFYRPKKGGVVTVHFFKV